MLNLISMITNKGGSMMLSSVVVHDRDRDRDEGQPRRFRAPGKRKSEAVLGGMP
jgi:hypothetical protein